MNIKELEKALNEYGDISLSVLIHQKESETPYKCPNCNGDGFIVRKIELPSPCVDGLMLTVYRIKNETIMCEYCNGIGYTDHELKPNMISEQRGWK